MSNVEILGKRGILGAIRLRLGAKDEHDESQDQKINGMTAESLVAAWTGWQLGDESWGHSVISLYKALS